MQSGPLGSREFDMNAGVLEQDGIVAGLGDFVAVREARPIALIGIGARTGNELYRAGASHHEKIKKVAAACAAEMRVAEAHDGRIRDVITGAPVPLVVEGVWTELYGAEGKACAGETVAMAPCSDSRVNPAQNIGRLRTLRHGKHRQGQSSRSAERACRLQKGAARNSMHTLDLHGGAGRMNLMHQSTCKAFYASHAGRWMGGQV